MRLNTLLAFQGANVPRCTNSATVVEHSLTQDDALMTLFMMGYRTPGVSQDNRSEYSSIDEDLATPHDNGEALPSDPSRLSPRLTSMPQNYTYAIHGDHEDAFTFTYEKSPSMGATQSLYFSDSSNMSSASSLGLGRFPTHVGAELDTSFTTEGANGDIADAV